MSDAPEKIGIAPCHPVSAPDDYYVVNPLHMRRPKVTEYIRADLYDAERAENARLRQLVISAANRMNRSAAIIMRDLDDPRILRATLKQNRSD